jgi:hypothetical protein
MPPICPTAAPPAPSSAQLVEDEDTLLDTAIQVACTIQEYQVVNGDINLEFFVDSLDNELVCHYIPLDFVNINTTCVVDCL